MLDTIDHNTKVMVHRNAQSANINTIESRNTNSFIRLTDVIFLRYVLEGQPRTGTIAVEFEYSSSDCSIKYLNVHYSDPELTKHVEGNPTVLRNIDSYLRNKLLKLEHEFISF
jgi:hypothetical protein